MITYKIFRLHDNGYIVTESEMSCLLEEFKQMEINDIFMVKKLEILPTDLEELPEFQGW